MKNRQLQNGFSLVEVMMAAGILAVGLVMIAGTFPVAIFLTAGSVEQTIAPIVADEAFAKIQLYSVNWSGLATTTACADFNEINAIKTATANINGKEYLYPSNNDSNNVYSWSAICRRVNATEPLAQVTVFVSRKTGAGQKYWDQAGNQVDRPTPVRITTSIPAGLGGNQFQVSQSYINDGCTIVANASGNIYRVLDHTAAGGNVVVTLDRDWNDVASDIWVVPPPVSGGRSPCIGVYQRIIKF